MEDEVEAVVVEKEVFMFGKECVTLLLLLLVCGRDESLGLVVDVVVVVVVVVLVCGEGEMRVGFVEGKVVT